MSDIGTLKNNFLPWYNKQSLALKRKIIFMHDNAPSHAARYTHEALAKFGFKEARLMVWPACSPDLNSFENFWSLLKNKVYKDGKQYLGVGSYFQCFLRYCKYLHLHNNY
jgi:transposase